MHCLLISQNILHISITNSKNHKPLNPMPFLSNARHPEVKYRHPEVKYNVPVINHLISCCPPSSVPLFPLFRAFRVRHPAPHVYICSFIVLYCRVACDDVLSPAFCSTILNNFPSFRVFRVRPLPPS